GSWKKWASYRRPCGTVPKRSGLRNLPMSWRGWRRWPTMPGSIWKRRSRPSTARAAPDAGRRHVIAPPNLTLPPFRLNTTRTMRRFFVPVALIALAVLANNALAQQRPKLQVTDVRLGYPSGYAEDIGQRLFQYKAGSWAPVSVDIQVGRDGLKGTEGRIDVVVETLDCDDVLTNYSVNVPLEKLGPNEQFPVTTFTKPAVVNSEVSVTLYYDGQPLTQPYKKSQGGLDANQALYLGIGSRLPNLRRALRPDNLDNQPNQPLRFDGRE